MTRLVPSGSSPLTCRSYTDQSANSDTARLLRNSGGSCQQFRWRPARGGMTLIEVLIATALTLVIMLALAQGFKTLSDGVTAGRARLTGSDQLRGISSLLKSDLSGLTVDATRLPQTQQAAMGYFEYYDGPLSDSTAMLYNYNPAAGTPEEQLSASRWSDIDDVLMFTAKAKDGQWFRGRVPLGLLRIHQRNITGDTTIQPTVQDWLTDVSIASEYAEIAWFMRPLDDVGMINLAVPPLPGPPPISPIDVAPGVDLDGDGVPETDGMPDRVALCRRVLLIRPDLNITPDDTVNPTPDPQLGVLPVNIDPSVPDSSRYQMRFAYQRSDLSVHLLYDQPGMRFVLRTNSLADLQIPENRFAHYSINLETGHFLSPATSLPILALTSETAPRYSEMITLAFGGVAPPADHGFIPAAFFRTKIDADSNGNVISVIPTMEEILASNVVGFDVRGYDGMVQQLSTPGLDGQWGTNGNPLNAGEAGTDDLVVGPSDPGYAVMIANSVSANVPLIIANSGAFVDLCWGPRVLNQLNNGLLPRTATLNGYVFPAAHRALWSTPLSGFNPLTGNVNPPSTLTSLSQAGRVLLPLAYQPTFDTFTDAYEADGNRQDFGVSANGLVRFGGAPSASNVLPDRGIDGLDNDGNGAVDEELEAETRPPFTYSIPSIQVKFRVQDIPAGTLQELAIVHDLSGN